MSRAASTLACSSPSGQPNSTSHVAWQQPRGICSLTLHLNDSLADELPVFASHTVTIKATVCDVVFNLNGGIEALILIFVFGCLLILI